MGNASTWTPSLVTLHDGRQVMNDSEEYRHECEARAILAMPSKAMRRAHLYGELDRWGKLRGGILGRRGQEAVTRLEDTMMILWEARRSSAA